MAAGALHIAFPSCAASSVLCLVNVGPTITRLFGFLRQGEAFPIFAVRMQLNTVRNGTKLWVAIFGAADDLLRHQSSPEEDRI